MNLSLVARGLITENLMIITRYFAAVLICIALNACGAGSSPSGNEPSSAPFVSSVTDAEISRHSAAVTALSVDGTQGSYTFRVTVSSPDTGCNQYADWWEVIGIDGALIYRRILTHSHVDEQPFTRSGGPINVAADQDVIVRAHMNTLGYGNVVFTGNVMQGFQPSSINTSFAQTQEFAEPLPQGCAF